MASAADRAGTSCALMVPLGVIRSSPERAPTIPACNRRAGRVAFAAGNWVVDSGAGLMTLLYSQKRNGDLLYVMRPSSLSVDGHEFGLR